MHSAFLFCCFNFSNENFVSEAGADVENKISLQHVLQKDHDNENNPQPTKRPRFQAPTSLYSYNNKVSTSTNNTSDSTKSLNSLAHGTGKDCRFFRLNFVLCEINYIDVLLYLS